ncbi:MAG: hypothetical protein QOJ19_4528 [Acidimicrobiia bacterium]|jgi:plastocyanin|nr:hypothetical protein [Acidimicrobiia bacterium]
MVRALRLLISGLLLLVAGVLIPVAPAGGAPAQVTPLPRLADTPTAVAQGSNAQGVTIVDFDFDARKLTVPVGTTVTWSNTGARPHTATDRGGTFDTQPIAPGAQASVNLTVPGTYFYFCRINPSKMNGTVEVQPTPADARVVRIQAVDDANIAGESLRFDPPNVTVKAGSTVLVANAGGKPHTLTADDSSFTTGVISPGPEGGRFAGTNALVTLVKSGSFTFHCEIHPQAMTGKITVVGEPAGAPPTSAAASTVPATAAVAAEDFRFREPQVSVHAGGQVTFTNRGQAPHTATFDDVQGLDTGSIAPGGSAALKAPDKPGNYSYKCTIHPASMRGVLVVLADTTPDPIRNVSTTTAAPPPPSGQAAGTATTAKPPAVTQAAKASGAVSTWVLVTAVIGSLLAGAGITALVRRRPPMA